MKIIDKTNFEWTELRNTFVGDIIFFEDTNAWGDEPFMVINDLSEVQCNECSHGGYYVLSLESFDVWEPHADVKVKIADAELIITNRED